MTAAPPPSQFACYTVAQAAQRLQCGPDAVRALCRRGALRSIRLGRMIRDFMGHASISTTERHYIHLTPDYLADAAAALE